ncbi:MAG: AAA family ATPase [Saprospiraceae bacterium]
MISQKPYIRSILFKDEDAKLSQEYPYNIPSIKECENIKFHPDVTFLIGENGSGKSTLLEAIAIAYGFNPEGGTKNMRFHTHESHSDLHENLRLSKGLKQAEDGYFLRAETFYNLATEIDDNDLIKGYGGKSMHKLSHGEAFIALMIYKLRGNGLYIFDEPEAALSPSRQLAALASIDKLVKSGSQFIIATHSPILLAYPSATIYELNENGIMEINYKDTSQYKITKYFMDNPSEAIHMVLSENNET